MYSQRMRKIILEALEHLPAETRAITEKALENLFSKALIEMPDGEIFVQTGDIPAMWIRDSSWQVLPLVRFVRDDEIKRVLLGVIAAQVKFLSIDPYANAFNIEPNGLCWHKDFEDQSDWVFERKWELDSLTSFLQLSLDLHNLSGIEEHLSSEWWSVVAQILDLFEREQFHDSSSYRFLREGAPDHDHLSNRGYGADFASCGLIWSAFRPSDDACELPFNIPANIHAYIMLERLERVAAHVMPALALKAKELKTSIKLAVERWGTITVDGTEIYAYEVDGLGGALAMDDANYPSILSLPFHGHAIDKRYLDSRNFSLSSNNPWYFLGSEIVGVGSPHTGPNRVWPLSVAMQGLTSQSETESVNCESDITRTRTADNHIHESIDVDNPKDFTREWFSWAEMTFVELAFRNHLPADFG